jgi:hypothetical protein
MPDFFDEVDSTGVVEDHIQRVLKLEHSQAETILGNFQEIQNELTNKLSRVRSSSFTAQHLRGVLAQVQGSIEALTKSLGGEMADGAFTAAMAGIENLLTEIKAFDSEFLGAVTPINLNAAILAKDSANFLVTRYGTNLDKYGNDLYTQISNGLFAATIGESSYSQVIGSIGQFFSAEEWKLHRVVRTELHNIYNYGKLQGMRDLQDDELPDLMKTLMHPMDQRTGLDSKYAASLALAVPVDAPFEYEWNGVLRQFLAPPDRPNDRAILVPYRKEWGATRGPAFITAKFPEA